MVLYSCSTDDFIDVILGSRVYLKCVYVSNKFNIEPTVYIAF